MKPITDDIVLSLIEGAKKRQRSIPANGTKPLRTDRADSTRSERAKVISLDLVRPVRRVRQTVSGVFFYAPRP